MYDEKMPLTTEVKLGTLGIQSSNFSLLISSEVDEVLSAQADPQYEQFLADVWIGIILTLIVLSCVCCMCSCLLYHKFQQWKRNLFNERNTSQGEIGPGDCESLPSYTIASGLPNYQEALEQLKHAKEQTSIGSTTKVRIENGGEPWTPHTPPTPIARLSVADLFQIYKNPHSTEPIKS